MISIVDDDKSFRESAKSLIRSLGYATATFASGEEFLESGCLFDTECLITDVQMPGMSGVDLIACLDRAAGTHNSRSQ
jgi:FixJ family two-component response regulator